MSLCIKVITQFMQLCTYVRSYVWLCVYTHPWIIERSELVKFIIKFLKLLQVSAVFNDTFNVWLSTEFC